MLPLSYSVNGPEAVMAIPPEEFESRLTITRDQCVVDGKDFYLRGRIPIPIHGMDEPFIWGVWAEVSPKNFLHTAELWNTEGREQGPPFTGYLNNQLPIYGDTLNLEVGIQTQPVGRRPSFFVKDAEHLIAREQRDGISLARIEQIAEFMYHPAAS